MLLALGQPLINIHGWSAPVVEENYRRAYRVCDSLGSLERFAALSGLYKYFVARGCFDTAAEIAEQCQKCAQGAAYRPLPMTGHLMRGIVHYFQGELEQARRELEAGLPLYDHAECQSFAQMFGDDPGVACLAFLARVSFLQGDQPGALALTRESLALARKIAHPHVLATALALAAHLAAWDDDVSSVADLADELSRISKTQSFALWSVIGAFFSIWVRCRRGDEDALSELRAALAEYDAVGAVCDRTTYATLLASSCLRLRRAKLGLEIADAALVIGPAVPIWEERLRSVRQQCEALLGTAPEPGRA
jgi:hypothetical protein